MKHTILPKTRLKNNSLVRLLRFVFIKLFRVNDTPQKVALGLGLGVFSGIMPGTGPLAALFLASLLKVNKSSALLGGLLTNTWSIIPVLGLAVKAGALVTGLRWQDVQQSWKIFLAHFHLADLFKLSILKVIMPVILGYFLIAAISGILAYAIMLPILKWLKQRKLKRQQNPSIL